MERVMDKPKEVKTPPSKETQLQRLDPQALIQSAIEKGSGIETLERLVALAKDVRAEQAREAWNVAMSEFQRTCPPVVKSETARIQSRRTGTGYSYSYAPLDGIMRTILPIMGPLGLSVSWRNRIETGKVVAICRISHDYGHHEESGEVAMPIPQDDAGATPPQRVGIAITYAKRYALMSITGLAPEDDDDAQSLTGRTVSQPRRASEPAPQQSPGKIWTGQVASVSQKTGKTKGKEWTLYIVKAKDGQEFGTFSESDAQFARAAGSSPVRIVWEETIKGSRKILNIDPAREREPGDESGAEDGELF